jgi:acetolactate synthase-1/2/3 large subunit
VTKHSFLVQSADEIPEVVAEAFYIATHGKPGPVVIDMPKNVQKAFTSAQYPERVSLRAYHPESSASTSQMTRFAKLVNAAKRPVLYAGGGVIASGAAKDVANLAHKAQIPVATTLMGLGAFDENDPLSLRLAGMHGTAAANWAIRDADLIIALGVRFSDRVTGKLSAYAKKAKIIHVDCDPSSINKNVAVDLGIVADVKDVLTTVNSRIKAAEHPEWLAQIAKWKKERPAGYRQMHKNVIMPQQAIEAIDKATKGKAVVVTDVGQQQMWAAQFFRHNLPRHFLSSGVPYLP